MTLQENKDFAVQDYADKFEATRRLKNNMLLLGRYCFPSAFIDKSPEFHKGIVSDLADYSIKRLLITAPRGFSKSTIASFLYVMYLLAFKASDEDLFIVIISEARQQAINFLTRIKYHVETSIRYTQLFGDFTEKNSARWREDDVIFPSGARVVVLGTGQKIRSFISRDTRPNVIIADDFESLKNTLTKESRAANRKWLTSSVIPALTPNGKMVVIGNVIHNDCFLMWAKESKSWTIQWYSALTESGESLWPGRFPLKALMNMKEEMASVGNLNGFYTEFMNQPMAPETAPFKPEFMFRHHFMLDKTYEGQHYLTNYSVSEKRDYDRVMIPVDLFQGIDPASSLSETADYFVIMTLAIDADGNVYIVDILRERLDPARQAPTIVEKYKKFKPRRVGIETVAYQEALRSGVRAIAKEQELYIPGLERGIRPRTSKSERLLSLVPLLARGKFFFRPQDIEAEKEFLSYPKSKNDDQMDAIWIALQGSKPCRIKKINLDKANKKNKLIHVVKDWMTM